MGPHSERCNAESCTFNPATIPDSLSKLPETTSLVLSLSTRRIASTPVIAAASYTGVIASVSGLREERLLIACTLAVAHWQFPGS